MGLPVPSVRDLFDGTASVEELAERGHINRAVKSAKDLAQERLEFVQEMTKATIAGHVGETTWGEVIDQHFTIPAVKHDPSKSENVAKAFEEVEMAKSVGSDALAAGLYGARSSVLAKEWTLTNPVTTGLIPFDLEAPAKLLTPRPTPLRNMIPRIKGQGGSRRFKVISGFTGTGTGGATTVQPGIGENTTNAGPGGLSYIRGPYINYDGYDVTLDYVTTSLSDSVSWQAQFGSAA